MRQRKSQLYCHQDFQIFLVNGTSGIAVGMATNIPPHNLREVISAVVRIIDDQIEDRPETTLEEILEVSEVLSQTGLLRRPWRGSWQISSSFPPSLWLYKHLKKRASPMIRVILTFFRFALKIFCLRG